VTRELEKEWTRKLALPHFVNLSTIRKQVDATTQMLFSVMDDHLVETLAQASGRSWAIRSPRRPASASSSTWSACSGWSRRSRHSALRLLSMHGQTQPLPRA
jgi:hypothetical protein